MLKQSNLSINLAGMEALQLKNMAKLMIKAQELGIDLNDYGHVGYNPVSKYTYLASDYVLYELCIHDWNDHIEALHSCGYDGTENFRNVGKSGRVLDSWATKLQRISEKKG